MIVVPRGKAVKEGIDPSRMDWREALKKLHEGHFTGYLNGVAECGRGLLLFVRGNLASIRYDAGQDSLTGAKALERVLTDSVLGRSRLDIYRLDPILALALYNVMEGAPLYRGQHCELLDMPHLLGLLKRDHFSGGLCVNAGDKAALIFMETGRFIGFFHDGESALATDADLPASVAWQPDARIDVIRSAGMTEANLPDLLQTVDLGGLWNTVLQAR